MNHLRALALEFRAHKLGTCAFADSIGSAYVPTAPVRPRAALDHTNHERI